MCKGLFLDKVDILKKYDLILQKHLEKGLQNAMYLSNHVQNDLLSSINNLMKQSIEQKKIIVLLQ